MPCQVSGRRKRVTVHFDGEPEVGAATGSPERADNKGPTSTGCTEQ